MTVVGESGPPLIRNAHQRPGRTRLQHDDTGAPCATACQRRLAQLVDRTGRDEDGFQLAAGKKSKPGPIGRPEWLRSSLRARQHPELGAGQIADQDLRHARGIRRGDREAAAIGRDSRIDGVTRHRDAFRQQSRHGGRFRRRRRRSEHGGCENGRRHDRGQRP